MCCIALSNILVCYHVSCLKLFLEDFFAVLKVPCSCFSVTSINPHGSEGVSGEKL